MPAGEAPPHHRAAARAAGGRLALATALLLALAGPALGQSDEGDAAAVRPTAEALFNDTLAAAEDGDAYAALKLGRFYRDGDGVAKDLAEAVAWLRRAADMGAPEALDDLGDLALAGIGAEGERGTPDGEAALAFYLRGAQAGLTTRLEKIGDLYARPDLPINDRARADEYWRRAAEAYNAQLETGEVWPAVRLARLYAEGKGVEASAERAIELYQLAVARGHPAALIQIGDIYFDGKIVAPDPAKAFDFYRQAEAAGVGTRLERMGNMYRDGTGVAADPAMADAYWQKAIADYRARAETDGWAALALGRMLRDGRGAPADPEAAVQFFTLADQLGTPGARREITDMRASVAAGDM